MCGIAGFISHHPQGGADLKALADDMAGRLKHRGPDDSGVWSDEDAGVYLAHRRLAIQDLSELGHQPMESASGRYVVVFNGEIYNFQKLRDSLEQSGAKFRGHSDTEVLLALIEEFGLKEALKKTHGMFALALWDRKEQRLQLGRDRMGEKPLYYGWLEERFVFGSEISAFRALPWWRRAGLSHDAIHLFLRHGYIPCPHSAFENIYKLPPGAILSLPAGSATQRSAFSPVAADKRNGQISPQHFWSLRAIRKTQSRQQFPDAHSAAEAVNALLLDTVQDQLISDVPVGTFLSGGIDSSLVTAVAQSVADQPVRTFSVGFDDPDFDEARFAKAIADHLGTDHSELYVDESAARNAIPSMPGIYDEPFADPSQIPTYLISGLAREHVTVVLSGDGGDELFGGYNRYLFPTAVTRKSKHLPAFARRFLSSALTLAGPATIDGLYARLAGLGRDDTARQTRVGLKIHKLSESLLAHDEFEMYERLISYWPDADVPLKSPVDSSALTPERFSMLGETDFWTAALAYDQRVYLPDNNLAKVDRASMAVSLETRLPLLDHRLVELSWRIPQLFNVSGRTGKQVLRTVLRNYVPERLFERPKMGFSVPVADWIRGPLKEWSGDLLSSSAVNEQGLLDSRKVSDVLAEHLSGKRDHSLKLWSVLMLQAWLQEQ